MDNIWLIAGGIVLAIVIIMLLVNLILFRSGDMEDKMDHASDRVKRKSRQRRLAMESKPVADPMHVKPEKIAEQNARIETESVKADETNSLETSSRPVRVTSELELMSDLLNEIEAGKGQEPDSAGEVDFAAVHTTFIKSKPQESPAEEKPHHFDEKEESSELQEWIREEAANPKSMGWLILKGESVFQSSDEFEPETEEVFREWKRLVDQTEKVLALTNLSTLQLSGVEGFILVKRKRDYMLFALRDGE